MKKCTIEITDGVEKSMLISAKVAMFKDIDLKTKVARAEYALELFSKLIETDKISVADLVTLK
jgi:hypothetical protein